MDNTKEKKPRERTLKEDKWIRAYLETGNKTEASRIAGYTPGSRGGKRSKKNDTATFAVVGNVNFKKFKDDITKEYEALGAQPLTTEFIIGGLVKIAKEGEKEASRIASLELLGKTKALFTDKSETINRTMQITQDITAPFDESPAPVAPAPEIISPPDAI